MKLQNLIIIFIIIIIPIILVFSYYLGLEADTIRMQTDYDEKLIEATREAVEAFEINTIEWSSKYSTLANEKRRSLQAAINTFTTSLANKLGIGGSSKEYILNYIPAVVCIMYDGYYIYSPTHVPQTITDDTGKQLYYYEFSSSDKYYTTEATMEKPSTKEKVIGEVMYLCDEEKGGTGTYNGKKFTTKIEDSKKSYKHVLKTFVPYTTKIGDYVINYTLDNYVRVYGTTVEDSNEGYILSENEIKIKDNNSINDITLNDSKISPETLNENVAVRSSINDEIEVKDYKYIYNSNNEKRYYDDGEKKFFYINNQNVKVYDLNEYKKLLVLIDLDNYIEIYQKLNGEDTWYFKNTKGEYIAYNETIEGIGELSKYEDCSAINFCVQNYCFNKWWKDKKINITNKNQAIINNINTNLNLAISNYSANSGMNFTIPELTEEDWEQALSNISIITFFQGTRIGLKTYNNYAIVTSTENNEYVAEDSLYYLDKLDENYHRYGCNSAQPNIGLDGVYKNIDFKVQSYTNKEEVTQYFYKHGDVDSDGRLSSMLQCFDCIVNRNNMETNEEYYIKPYYNALARERYIQMQRTRVIDGTGIKYEPMIVEYIIDNSGRGPKIILNISGGSEEYTIQWERQNSIGQWEKGNSTTKEFSVSPTVKAVKYTVTDNETKNSIWNTIKFE